MYKALIVDDESIIRCGIKQVIPWESINIGETYTAGGASEALKLIERHMPDILITDINMPGITGLELVERVYDIKPDIKIIVITGYDLFEYVHKCIKMHVNDFFLKPVDEDELTKAIFKLVEQLEEERRFNEIKASYDDASDHLSGASQLADSKGLYENMHGIVKQAKDIINSSLSEGTSVLSIAAKLYVSPSYLSRLFKKVMGEGCNEYITRKRIEKAKSLLESTNLPSGRIAGMVGYQDINYFSVAFKKQTGVSPTKFRESVRGDAVSAWE
ncbi:MAG: response regulator [Clostridiales bacterium]|jgi:two-component system response regulator YesN|nr:response regulator [Clostridiales bacterium]